MSDPSVPWLAAGFAVAWLILGAYLVRLWRAHRDVIARLDSIERRTQPPTGSELG